MDEIVAYAMKFQQHDINLYTFNMSYKDLLDFVEVIPHSEDHPDYPQRPISSDRLESVAEYVSDRNYIPPSIVLNLYKSVLVKDLEPLANVGKISEIRIPKDGKKHAYCLDGQHRLFAFDISRVGEKLSIGNASFEYAIVAFHNVPFPRLVEQYMTINTKQEKVNPDQIVTMKGRLVQLQDPEQKAFNLATLFSKRPDSVLKDRIFFMPGDKNKIIKVKRFVQLVKPYLLDQNAILGTLVVDDIYRMMNAYLKAWQQLFPEAWNHPKNYVLLKTAGIETMFTLFEPAYRRCKLFYNANFYAVQGWLDMLNVLKTEKVDLTRPGETEQKELIDWKSEKYGQFCSGKPNISFFVRAMKKTFEEGSPTKK